MSGKEKRPDYRSIVLLLGIIALLGSGLVPFASAFSSRPDEAPAVRQGAVPPAQKERLPLAEVRAGKENRPGDYAGALSDEQADFSEDAGGLPAAENEQETEPIPRTAIWLRDVYPRVFYHTWPDNNKLPSPKFRETAFSPEKAVNLDMVERFTGPLGKERRQFLQKNRFLLLPLEECRVDPATPMLELFSLIGKGRVYGASSVSNALFVGPDPFLHALRRYASARFRYLEQTRLSIALVHMLEGLHENAVLMAQAAGPAGAASFRRLQAQFLLPLAILKSALPGGAGGASSHEQALQEQQAREFGTSLPASGERALELARTYDIAEEYLGPVEEELQNIFRADTAAPSPLLARLYGVERVVDYGRFLPGGRYRSPPVLRSYYRAMQWLECLAWDLDEEAQTVDAVNFALLMSMEPPRGESAGSDTVPRPPCEYWGELMEITSFFLGFATEPAYPEWARYLKESVGVESLGPDTASSPEILARVRAGIADIGASSPFFASLRRPSPRPELGVFPRRFSVSGFLQQELTRHNDPERTDLPELYSSLWTAAVLGSPHALELIGPQVAECMTPQNTATPFHRGRAPGNGDSISAPLRSMMEETPGPSVTAMRMGIHRLGLLLNEETAESWTSSLDSAWLYLLRNLAGSHSGGMPLYMRSPEFQAKQLESVLGSLAEREPGSLAGDGEPVAGQAKEPPGGESVSDKAVPHGFVEPNPPFWRSMFGLVDSMAAFFEAHELFLEDLAEGGILRVFRNQVELCAAIAEKEVRGKRISRQEYEALRDGLDLGAMAGPVEAQAPHAAGNDGEAFCLLQSSPSHLLYGATARPRIMLVLTGDGGLSRVTVGVAYNHQEFVTAPDAWLTGGQWRQWNAAAAGGQQGIPPLPVKPFWYDGLETR